MNKKITAQIGLLFVTIIWGLTFIMVKEALDDAPPFTFATLRFGLATILTLFLVKKKSAPDPPVRRCFYKGTWDTALVRSSFYKKAGNCQGCRSCLDRW